MTDPVKRAVYWAPRILGLLFAAFIGLFALDVFGEGYGFWETIAALFIHLVPTWILLVILALAWRWEWIGAVAFAALGVAYIVMAWGKFEWLTYLLISGPLFLMGALFLVNWLLRKQLRAGT
jgi:hypothetical protein